MNKNIYSLTFALFILLSLNSFSQSKVNISFGGTYGFGIFKNSVETFINTKQEENKYFNENKKFSLGGGLGIYASTIYSIGENFGIGMGIHHHFNNEIEFIEVNSVSGIIAENTRTLSASRFSILPMVELKTNNKIINAFIQMGVSFNFTNQKLKESIAVNTSVTEYYWNYKGKSKLGFFTNLGLSYHLNSKLSLAIGIIIESYQYSPTSNTLERLTIDGDHVSIANLPEIEKSVEFVDWVADQYSQYPDPNKPLQSPKQSFIYNNASLFLGLSYRF